MKNKLLRKISLMCTVMLVLSNLTSNTTHANPAVKTKTVTFDEELDGDNRSQTIDIPDVNKIVSVKVADSHGSTDGNAEATIVEEGKVKVDVSGGSPSRTEWNTKKFSKEVTDVKRQTVNTNFPEKQTITKDGYTGEGVKIGTHTQVGGTYIPEQSITDIRNTVQGSDKNSAPATVIKDGVTLKKIGAPQYVSGTPRAEIDVYDLEYGYSMIWHGEPGTKYYGIYKGNGYYEETRRVEVSPNFPGVLTKYNVPRKSGGVYPVVTYVISEGGGVHKYYDVNVNNPRVGSEYYFQFWGGKRPYSVVSSIASTEIYRQNYAGIKPEVDTRVYEQQYKGTGYKGGNDEYYKYTVEIEYIDDITPPELSHTLNNPVENSHSPVTITIKSTDTQSGPKEIWMEDSDPIPVNAEGEVNFTVTKNGTYKFKSRDNANNETPDWHQVTVTNITTQPATIAEPNNFNSWYNESILVTISNSDSNVKELRYKIYNINNPTTPESGGSITDPTEKTTVSLQQNQTIKVESVSGNPLTYKDNVVSKTITNIDTKAPIIKLKSK